MVPKSAADCESRLEKLNAEFEEFAYIVSHDLKAPVRAIANLSSWLEEDLEGNLPGDSQQNFRLLKSRVTRLESMIQALLDYSRVSRFDLEIGTADLHQILKSLLEKLAAEKEFRVSVTGLAAPFLTYQPKLVFVLKQLLQNAVFFNNKEVPEITIALTEQPEHLEISIADNGPGIPENSLTKIFTIFYTAQAKETLDTTGAGLAIANKIVNFVGGNLSVANKPDGGAVFTLNWSKQTT